MVRMAEPIVSPILNRPYDQPDRHFFIGTTGPTGEIRLGRRPSESFIPIAAAKKGQSFASGATQEAERRGQVNPVAQPQQGGRGLG